MGTYLETRRKLLEQLDISKDIPDLIACWSEFVEECEEGYSWDISEYNNEIRVRNDLEKLLTNAELLRFQEHQFFVNAVLEIDIRFRKLLHNHYQLLNKDGWWARGVLKAAGKEYVEYVRKAYGFEISLKE